jgi:hypothetical protein
MAVPERADALNRQTEQTQTGGSQGSFFSVCYALLSRKQQRQKCENILVVQGFGPTARGPNRSDNQSG